MVVFCYVFYTKCVVAKAQNHSNSVYSITFFLDASSPLCFMQLGRGRYVKTQLSLYPIYYADDGMFRPLWAIFRSQNV